MMKDEPKYLLIKVTEVDKVNEVVDKYGVVYSTDGKRLLRGWQLAKRKYTIKNGTKTICDWAFNDCKGLDSIKLPNGLTSIGEGAFDGCENLKTISITNSVTEIGWGAFMGCDRLEKISIRSVCAAREESVLAKFRRLLPLWLHDKIEIERTRVSKLYNMSIELGWVGQLAICVVPILFAIIALVIILVGAFRHFEQGKFVVFLFLGGFFVGALGGFVEDGFHKKKHHDEW